MVQQSGEDETTGILFDTIMEQRKEYVANEFLKACGDDEAKRRLVLELCRKVLNREQYSRIVSAQRTEETEQKHVEGDSEEEQKVEGYDENVENDSTDDSIPTMRQIEDKPYLDGISAETGELPFEEFKDLLEPNEDQQENQQSSRRGKRSLLPKKDAIKQFGEKDATMLVNWYHHVKHSGQLYSDEWLDGKIRDINLGKIEDQMLLMCLQEKRISKALASVLGKICEDLNLQSTVQKALEEWGVEDRYPSVWARRPGDQYTDNIKKCRQCEIFVARAYVCISVFKHKEVSDDLGNKLLSCFELMENYLPRDLAKIKVRRTNTSTDSERKSAVSSTQASTGDAETRVDGIIQQLAVKTNVVLDEFSSIEDVVARIGSQFKDSKELKRNIMKVLKGEQTSACGFIWRYKQKPKSQKCTTNTMAMSVETKGEGDDHADTTEDNQSAIQNASGNKRLDKTVSTRPEQSASSTKFCAPPRHDTNKDSSGYNETDRIIEQIDPRTGEVEGAFSSVEDLNSKVRFKNSNPKKYIRRVLDGSQKTFEGFIYRYKGETDKRKSGSTTGDDGDARVDGLHTTEQHHGKRKSPCDDSREPTSIRTKPNLGHLAGQPADSNSNGKHVSVAGMQAVSGNSSSRSSTMRAITAMDHVKESPYLKQGNAEVGEEMFDSFKDLLVPRGSGRHLDASYDAKRLFGEILAREMVTANSAIAKSGMVYGSDWKNGNIQGRKCGIKSPHQLLLCLQEQRLASSSPDQLRIVISDLAVVDMVQDALKDWELESDFPLLKGIKHSSALHSRTKALLACLIFVARSYRCMKMMKRKNISDSVMRKVRECLVLFHSSLEHKQTRETAQGKRCAEHIGAKSAQTVGQIQKANSHNHNMSSNVGQREVVGDTGSPEPVKPGFIMHNLFLKPAKVSEEPPKKKPKQTAEPSRAVNPSITASPVGPTTNRIEIVADKRPNSAQKQPINQPPVNQPAGRNLEPSQLTQPQLPKSRKPQHAQKTPSKPSQDSRPQANQEEYISRPTNIQNASNSQPSTMPMGTWNPTSSAPSSTLSQPAAEIPLPDFIPPVGNWCQQDDMLSDTETELAWLTSECTFALRLSPQKEDWQFIWKYASPLLKKELREISGELKLHRLVRLHDGFVRKSFEILKATIEKDLNRGNRRPHMEKVIRVLRKRSRRLANQGRSSAI